VEHAVTDLNFLARVLFKLVFIGVRNGMSHVTLIIFYVSSQYEDTSFLH